MKLPNHAETASLIGESSAPWITPGQEKETWKDQGNHCDYRELRISRPADLKISISEPRQFVEA